MRHPAVPAHGCGSRGEEWSDEEDELNGKNLYTRAAKGLHPHEW